MRRHKSQHINEIMHLFLRSEGLETPYNEYKAKAAWVEIAGDVISKATADIQIQNSKMFIKINSPALRQDLSLGHTQLTQRINAFVGAQVIEDIIFY